MTMIAMTMLPDILDVWWVGRERWSGLVERWVAGSESSGGLRLKDLPLCVDGSSSLSS